MAVPLNKLEPEIQVALTLANFRAVAARLADIRQQVDLAGLALKSRTISVEKATAWVNEVAPGLLAIFDGTTGDAG